MDNEIIINHLETIFSDVLGVDIKLKLETVADDIENWDSLNHIHLVVAIEKFFKIRFGSREIRGWKNIGEMVHSIHDKF